MAGYYATTLAGERLRLCYDLAPPRVRQYLDAEIDFLLNHVSPGHRVLELGCGYGRALRHLVARARQVVGIDTSQESLRLAGEILATAPNCSLHAMDAIDLGFPDHTFDIVACIQNGISAFAVDRVRLVREAMRVTRPGGIALFSSYSPRFWEPRLEWFRRQADHGLIGPIDEQATGDGVIVCTDGFRATTIGTDDFQALAGHCGVQPRLTEVDASSLFCAFPAPG